MNKINFMSLLLLLCFALAAGCSLLREIDKPVTLSNLVVSASDITLELDTQYRQHNLEVNYPVGALQICVAADNPEYMLQVGTHPVQEGCLIADVPLKAAENTITITILSGEVPLGRYTIVCYRKPVSADTWEEVGYTHRDLGVVDVLAKIRENDYDFYYYRTDGDPALLHFSRRGGFLNPRENALVFLNQRYIHNGQIWKAYDTIEYVSYSLDSDSKTLRVNFKSKEEDKDWEFYFVLQRRDYFYLGFAE